MARKGSELTVQDEGSTLETQSRAITRRKKGEIAPLDKDQALVIEELEIAFDDDLRAAIIQSLLRNKEWIKQQANTERASSVDRFRQLREARYSGTPFGITQRVKSMNS
ncbi:hypothetical protein [Nostoc sp.]|uniref:hypothetical protein n=1 Tax=Nostoc sp. TaxID=1180 RepID=UPI002FF5B8B0